MKISACLVIHNEEKCIKSCLESIACLVDEIIIVHDGPCTDESLNIAKKFKAKTFTREYIGEAEYHRPFTYKEAKGEWILQIDADEYLPENIKEKMEQIINQKQIDAFNFWWPYSREKSYISSGPFAKTYKSCLLRKSKMFMIGIAHEYPRTYGKESDLKTIQLYHLYDRNKYTNECFQEKWNNRAKIQAKQIYAIDKAPLFNITKLNGNPVYKYYKFMKNHPVLSGISDSLKYLYIYIKKGILTSGSESINIARYELRYLWLVRKYLRCIKEEQKCAKKP